MSRRDHIIQIIGTIAGALLAGFLAQYGIRIPAAPPPGAPGAAPPAAEATPAPMPQPTLKPDPMGSRVKIRTTKGGCTAAVVGPQRSDGRYLVACAAHCVAKPGDQATGTMPNGEQLTLIVQSIDTRADCSWLLTGPAAHPLPFINLAATNPPAGRRVWVAGYGQLAPGVQRWGTVTGGPTPDGQMQYKISVSPGDSGGPIVDDETGELLGTVCCTAAFGRDATTFGAGPVALANARPRTLSLDPDWVPVPMPTR